MSNDHRTGSSCDGGRLEFERAAHLRDQIKELKKRAGLEKDEDVARAKKEVKYSAKKK